MFQLATKTSLMMFKLATKISLMMFKLAMKISPKTQLRTVSTIQAFASVTRKTETAKPGLPRIRKSAASKDGGAKLSPKTAQHRVAYASQRISQKRNQTTSQRRKTASTIQAFAFATRKT